MNDKTELVVTDAPRTAKAFNYIIRVYYGLNPDSEKFDDVILSTISKINLKYPSLTFEQLNLSYSETTIEKKQGVSLTEGELIAPITQMNQKTAIIRNELEKIEKENEKIKIEQQEANKFISEAKDLYNRCLPNKKWTGTPFQSATFVRDFADEFTTDEKAVVWERCQRLRIQLVKRFDKSKTIDVGYFLSDRHLFYQKITHLAIKRGLKLKN